MSGARCYAKICKATSLDKAVADLSDSELLATAEYLSDMKPEGGIPAQVFGMVTARLNASGKAQQEVDA